jgi:hypothetical protein
MNDMFKLGALWINIIDKFQWSIMIGYGNSDSYIPQICPKNACNERPLHIFPVFKGVIHFSLRNSKVYRFS